MTIIEKLQECIREAQSYEEVFKLREKKLCDREHELTLREEALKPKEQELKVREQAVEGIELPLALISENERRQVQIQEERAVLEDAKTKFKVDSDGVWQKINDEKINIAKEWKKLRG